MYSCITCGSVIYFLGPKPRLLLSCYLLGAVLLANPPGWEAAAQEQLEVAESEDEGIAKEEIEAEEIEEIIVTSTRSRRSFAEQVTRVEVLGGEEINEKANMKPGDIRMLLNESTGIHVQQTSATSFNSSIRIQGLDGRYTQLLRDGMPLYEGFSGGLGLLQTAPLDLQRVEVVKGASSTLYGGGAIAGLVNLISRTPGTDAERSLLLNATSARGVDASGFFSDGNAEFGSTLFTSYNRSEAYDPADNGLSAIPEFERITLNPRLFFSGPNSELTAGFNAVAEDRLGGDMVYIAGNRTAPAWFEASSTKRLATQLHYVRQLHSGNELVLKNSISHFRRELTVPGFEFAGTQAASFSEAHINGTSNALDWGMGFNLWTENFDHRSPAPGLEKDGQKDGEQDSPQNDTNSHTAGIFIQGTLPLANRWILEGGLRVDQAADYGTFVLPRVSMLFTVSPATTVRIGGGLGYKEPTLFTDEAQMQQYEGVLPLQAHLLDAEQSAGANIDVNHRFALAEDLALNLNLLLFYTRVDDPLRLVPQEHGRYEFAQPHDTLDTRGTEINAVWSGDKLKLVLGYTHADVREHQSAEVVDYPLVPVDRLNTMLVYESEGDFRVGLEAYYYGKQRLSSGRDSRDYWILGLMMEKFFAENFSLFLNLENLTDTRQTRYGPLFSGTLANPEFADIYAPLDGFVINGGIKLQL